MPTLFFLGLVLAYPVIYAGYLSVHQVGLAQLRRGVFAFNGWDNYSRVLEDPLFWIAIKNTSMFTAITVGSEVVLAVLIALLLNQTGIWTSRITRFLILLPYAIPPIANGLIWSFLYSFQFGFLNRILFTSGVIDDPINWARQSRHGALRRHRALYLANPALRDHPGACGLARHPTRTLRGGSRSSGARAWHRFWRITLAAAPPDRRDRPGAAHRLRLRRLRGNPSHHPGRSGRRHLGGRLVQLQDHLLAAEQFRHGLGIGLHPDLDDRHHRSDLHAHGLSPGDALMFATSRTTQLMLHIANLMVIAFILLPLVAVLIGSIQSEKALQADTRRVLPLEFTLDNFTVILTKGEQRGRIFEQVTYLPDNIKNFYTAFLNSAIVAGSVTVPDAALRVAVSLHHRPPALPLDPLPAASQHRRSLRAGDRADDPVVRGHAVGWAAQLALGRHHRGNRLPPALCDPDPGPYFDTIPPNSKKRRASTDARGSAPSCTSCCRWRRRRSRPAGSSCSSFPGTSC